MSDRLPSDYTKLIPFSGPSRFARRCAYTFFVILPAALGWGLILAVITINIAHRLGYLP